MKDDIFKLPFLGKKLPFILDVFLITIVQDKDVKVFGEQVDSNFLLFHYFQ